MPATTGEPGGLTRAVAAALRERLARLDRTQQWLATQVEIISQSHLSQMLKGRKHINMEQFGRLCDVMDLDPVQVIDRAWHEALDDEIDVDQAELDERYAHLVPPEEDAERITGT